MPVDGAPPDRIATRGTAGGALEAGRENVVVDIAVSLSPATDMPTAHTPTPR
jgi:hypothetical protein